MTLPAAPLLACATRPGKILGGELQSRKRRRPRYSRWICLATGDAGLPSRHSSLNCPGRLKGKFVELCRLNRRCFLEIPAISPISGYQSLSIIDPLKAHTNLSRPDGMSGDSLLGERESVWKSRSTSISDYGERGTHDLCRSTCDLLRRLRQRSGDRQSWSCFWDPESGRSGWVWGWRASAS